MEFAHLHRIGLHIARFGSDGTLLASASRTEIKCCPLLLEPIRDASQDCPALFESRLRKKRGFSKAACQALDLDRSYDETLVAWTKTILSSDFKDTLNVTDILALNARQWYEEASRPLSDFCAGILNFSGFQEALARDDKASLERIVRDFLVKWSRHPRGKQLLQKAARSGTPIPFWRNDEGDSDLAQPYFDCIIVEPFDPEWDPSFLLDPDGMRRTGAAVLRLQSWVENANAKVCEALLKELAEITVMQQEVLREMQKEVATSLEVHLREVLQKRGDTLHSVVPFGSVEFRTATAESDVDICAFVHSSLAPAALARSVMLAMEATKPSWLCVETLRDLLQTSRVPIITFQYQFNQKREMPCATRLAEVLNELGIKQHPQSFVHRVAVDLSFNNAQVERKTTFFRDTLGSDPVVFQLLVWLKYWTKSEAIACPQFGTLSSYGWKMILIAILIELGIVPCLRDGFQDVVDPPLLGALNYWFASRSNSLPARTYDCVWPVLRRVAYELNSCVGAQGRRVFQVVTRCHRDLDNIFDAMGASSDETIWAEVKSAVDNLPAIVRLIFCDVDGVLFPISKENRAKDLTQDDTVQLFFNTKRSVPHIVEPRVFDFLCKARDLGYRVFVVSGRGQEILAEVRNTIEREQRGTCLQPCGYVFKRAGARNITVEHKAEAVRQVLQYCVDSGKDVKAIGFLDDLEPHMTAFLQGACDFGVPTFALNVFGEGPRFQHHNAKGKHIVILALPYASNKTNILEEACALLPSAKVVVWSAVFRVGLWEDFVHSVLDAMNTPGVEYILIKMAPDLEKVRKLHVFLSRGNSICCFYQALEEESGLDLSDFPLLSGGCVLSGLQLLHQFQRILQNNEARTRAGELYINIPDGRSLCDRGEKIQAVWLDEKAGVAGVFARLAKKSREVQRLLAAKSNFPCLVCKPLQFYDMFAASCLTDIAKNDFKETITLLSRRDTGKNNKAEAMNASRLLRRFLADSPCAKPENSGSISDIFTAVTSLARNPADIAQEIVEALHEVSAKSLVSREAPLEDDLRSFLD